MNDQALDRRVETVHAGEPGAVALELAGVVRTFHQGDARLEVLRAVDLKLHAGEVLALVGPSGSGKSTLLQIAGLLEHPDGGEVSLVGEHASGLADAERTRLRRERLGFVYQFHHLLPEFSALENVRGPQMLAGGGLKEAPERAGERLALLGVAARAGHRPARLSGGEQQRVAIARALANRPAVLLADEPTGNLDEETADGVFNHLVGVVREQGSALLVATHNMPLARRADGIVALHGGLLERLPR
jgi:lipoprotein-releasing system ATP-binding protein